MKTRLWPRLVALVAALALGTGAAAAGEPATPATIAGATVAFDPIQAYEPKGVSSFAFIGPGGTTWLFASNGPGGVEAHTSADGLAWTKQTVSGLPQGGNDITIVEESPGHYRAYVAKLAPTAPGSAPNPACTGLSLATATSTDLRSWTAEAGSGLSDLGCGVPQVVKNPAGGYLLYFVSGKNQGGHGAALATSSDGRTFQKTGGLLIGEDLVDPSVIRLPDGSWLMAYATFFNPMSAGDPFRDIGLASSTDGITWAVAGKKVLETSDRTRLDPTLLLLPDGRIRIYYSEYPVGVQEVMGQNPTIRSGILTLKAGAVTATPTATPVQSVATVKAAAKTTVAKTTKAKAKTTTITCVKGKSSAKITGTNPKCPTGWKKR